MYGIHHMPQAEECYAATAHHPDVQGSGRGVQAKRGKPTSPLQVQPQADSGSDGDEEWVPPQAASGRQRAKRSNAGRTFGTDISNA